MNRSAANRWLGVLACCGLALLFRFRAGTPLIDWDTGTYATIGHELLHGGVPYRDAWDVKPPGIFIAYALSEMVAGFGARQVQVLGIVCAIATVLAAHRAAGRAWASAAPVSAVLSAVFVADPTFDALRTNTECFINLFILLAVASLERPTRWGALISAGLMFGIASMFKQVSVLIAIPLLLAYTFDVKEIGRSMLRAVAPLSVIALLWAGAFAIFALAGTGELFRQTMIDYPRFYAGDPLTILRTGLGSADGLLLLPALYLAATLIKARPRRFIIWLAWMLGTALAVSAPGRQFAHYHQLWFPPLAVGAGWAAAVLLEIETKRRLSRGAIAVVLLCTIGIEWRTTATPTRYWDERRDGPYLTWLQVESDELKQLLKPGETFFQWADEPWLYVALNQRTPAPTLWRAHTLEGPVANFLTDATIQKLSTHPPTIIVTWSAANALSGDHPLSRWIAQRYARIENRSTLPALLEFYRRRNDLAE